MPAHRLLPDTVTLQRWLAEGLTHAQIADRIYNLTGQRVARSTVSSAIHRAALSSPGNRYSDELPWRVKTQHQKEYPARMLRLVGRRRAGLDLDDEENQRLDSWLSRLEADRAVVGYDLDSTFGFYYIDKDDPRDGHEGIPIRRQTVRVIA